MSSLAFGRVWFQDGHPSRPRIGLQAIHDRCAKGVYTNYAELHADMHTFLDNVFYVFAPISAESSRGRVRACAKE